jgi:hypothetical protein
MSLLRVGYNIRKYIAPMNLTLRPLPSCVKCLSHAAQEMRRPCEESGLQARFEGAVGLWDGGNGRELLRGEIRAPFVGRCLTVLYRASPLPVLTK